MSTETTTTETQAAHIVAALGFKLDASHRTDGVLLFTADTAKRFVPGCGGVWVNSARAALGMIESFQLATPKALAKARASCPPDYCPEANRPGSLADMR